MKGYDKNPFALVLTLFFMSSFAVAGSTYSREELDQYQEKTLMAPDFSLKSLDGKTYSLSDYRGKKIVVIETGSST